MRHAMPTTVSTIIEDIIFWKKRSRKMGFYISLEDAANKFQTVLDDDGDPICDGKYVDGIELFSIIARQCSMFIEFGDGDKSVRPANEFEFAAARKAITESDIANKDLGLEILGAMEQNANYYLTPSY